jgi:hypothetical protein
MATVHLGLWSLILCVLNIGLSVGVVIAVGMLLFFQVRTVCSALNPEKFLNLSYSLQIRAIVNNRTGIEDWIVEKAKYRREGTDSKFTYPYDLGCWQNIKQVINWSCSPVGDGFSWALAENCDQFTLTVRTESLFSCRHVHFSFIDFISRRNSSPKRPKNVPAQKPIKLLKKPQVPGCHFGRRAAKFASTHR